MAATAEMMMKNSPKIQFLLQNVFESKLPSRYPALIPFQSGNNAIDLSKAFIKEAHGPVVNKVPKGFMHWLPQKLHFEPYRESFWYTTAYSTITLSKAIDSSLWSNVPTPKPKSKNKFSKFMDKPKHRPKKIKAKGNR